MQSGSITKVSLLLALLIGVCGCHPGKPRARSIGEAFVGPATLKIRSDIPLESAPVATVKHGERLEILQRRRRFLRVRTPSGAEGWTDERQLLSAEDMAALKDLSSFAAKLPPQGRATSYGELNMHTQPSRTSPSFFQIREKEKFDVLAHLRAPRTDVPRKPLIPPAPKKAKAEPKRSAAKPSKYPPPPMPKPPPPPADWLELSKTNPDDEEEEAEAADEPAPKPIPTDDWSLVRAPSGQTGWVLTRRVMMAIPDEVAQYAEGHRIVSYFSLGKIDDGGEKKDVWLWTTTTGSGNPYDFDSFRVFIWSLRRHRYETAHIERNIEGYSPVLLKDVDYSTAGNRRGETSIAKYPGFSVCMANSAGQRTRREYALLGNIVRFAGERPCEPAPSLDFALPKPAPPTGAADATPPAPAPQAPKESLGQRLKKSVESLLHRKK